MCWTQPPSSVKHRERIVQPNPKLGPISDRDLVDCKGPEQVSRFHNRLYEASLVTRRNLACFAHKSVVNKENQEVWGSQAWDVT
jgi:hypothetical protein